MRHENAPATDMLIQTNNTTYFPEKFVNREIYQQSVTCLNKNEVFIGLTLHET